LNAAEASCFAEIETHRQKQVHRRKPKGKCPGVHELAASMNQMFETLDFPLIIAIEENTDCLFDLFEAIVHVCDRSRNVVFSEVAYAAVELKKGIMDFSTETSELRFRGLSINTILQGFCILAAYVEGMGIGFDGANPISNYCWGSFGLYSDGLRLAPKAANCMSKQSLKKRLSPKKTRKAEAFLTEYKLLPGMKALSPEQALKNFWPCLIGIMQYLPEKGDNGFARNWAGMPTFPGEVLDFEIHSPRLEAAQVDEELAKTALLVINAKLHAKRGKLYTLVAKA